MNQFSRAASIPMKKEMIENMAKSLNIPIEEVKRVIDDERKNTEIFMNDTYQVAKRLYPSEYNIPIIHLSIKRLDKEPIHDWRDMQKIKNAIVGVEVEMWECYPKESMLVDTANQYHMWGFATEQKIIPFGFTDPRRTIDHDPEHEKLTNTKQRKFT